MGIATGGHDFSIDSASDIVNNGYGAFRKIFVGGIENGGTSVTEDDGTVLVDGIDFNGYHSEYKECGGIIIGGYSNDVLVPGNQTVISKNNKC